MLRAMSVVKLNATQEIYLNQSIFIYKSYEKKNVPESTLEFFGSVSRDSSLNHSWILQILSGIVLLKILRLFLNFLPDIALGFIQKKRYHSGITSEILSDIPLRLFWTSFWIFLQNSVCDFACISLRITFEIQEIKFFEILENCFRNTMEDFTINPDAIHLDI